MPETEVKLNQFIEAIHADAKMESDRIQSETDSNRSDAKKQAESEILNEIQQQTQKEKAKISAETGQSIFRQILANRKAIQARCEKIKQDVLQLVAGQVLAYASTTAYQEELIVSVHAETQRTEQGNATVYLRQEDAAVLTARKVLHPDLRIEVSGDIRYGGFILLSEDGRLRIDRSYDSALEDAEEQFSELSGLKSVEQEMRK
ncbi:MAG: V-type ATP synthase subunit E family protein [Clostridiales bacterium]|nr:V-type ATP synthase subunit E family protein [Clostridiales bacterium]